MRKKNTLTLTAFITMFFMVLSVNIFGQEAEQGFDISDQELKAVVQIADNLQHIQNKGNETINGAIADSELPREKFVEMYEAAQLDPEAAMAYTEKETAEFNSLIQHISSVEVEIQSEMIKTVESSGMEVNRFNIIISQVQQDPELRSRIQSFGN